MYVRIKAHIKVERSDGSVIAFTGFNDVVIERDLFKINTICRLKMPLSVRLRNTKTGRIESVQSSTQFKRGDKISVQLGYDEDLVEEFTGYIYRINYAAPLEIECEGSEFLLRGPVATRTWSEVSIGNVLSYIIAGTGVVLRDDVPGMTFKNFVIGANLTRLEALQLVKDKYGLTVYFLKNQLYVGLAYSLNLGTVKYRLGFNTIVDNELKYRIAEDVQLKIKAVWIRPDNTKLEVEVGDSSGSQRTLFFYDVSSQEELKKIAKEEMQKYKYSGYEGKITTFLQPYAEPGYKAVLADDRFPERAGNYYVTKTEVKVGTSGARRIVEFSIKL